MIKMSSLCKVFSAAADERTLDMQVCQPQPVPQQVQKPLQEPLSLPWQRQRCRVPRQGR